MNDISFMVQGKISSRTRTCLESIRQFYPDAPIILSTWEDEPVADLSYDVLVVNKDPGAVEFRPGAFNNVNRQIVSTSNGLQAVSTTYAVKMRTDIQFVDRSLQTVLTGLPKARLFKKRIAALNLFFRDPRKWPLLFHIGDIFHAGYTADLCDLWSIPLAPEPATSLWAESQANIFTFDRGNTLRYVPEQYIFISFLNKRGFSLSLDHCYELTVEKARVSEEEIASNFSIFNPDSLGIHIPFRFVEHGAPTLLYTAAQLEEISARGPDIKEIGSYIRKRHHRQLREFIRQPQDWPKWLKRNLIRSDQSMGISGVDEQPLVQEAISPRRYLLAQTNTICF